MSRFADIKGVQSDISLGVSLAVLAVGVTSVSTPSALTALVAFPFVLFVPGYVLTVALFPRGMPGDGSCEARRLTRRVTFDRAVLSVGTSVALAVVVGVNVEFTAWKIRPAPIVGALAAITVLSAVVGLVRRGEYGADARTRRTSGESWVGRTQSVSAGGATVANVAVAVAVVTSLASVAAVGAMDQRGESYTEFGLLTETASGELVATDHPSNLTLGEPATLHYAITNKEQRTTEYVVVVQLVAVEPDGDVGRRARLETFTERLDPGQETRRRHTVTPTFTGERLRLTYLLYRSDVPERPTASNAYRELHLWVDVTADG